MLNAAEPLFTVLPWNGYKAAVSLTFDDGDPVHLDFAIPEMKKRGIKGTFFLVSNSLTRPDEWKQAAADGMEIGNHSATHGRANELDEARQVKEVDGSGKFLRELSGQDVMTYAYPFCEITDGLKRRIEKSCFIARGGSGTAYTADSEPDWYNIYSQAAMTNYAVDIYREWIDRALDAGAWQVFLVHAIEESNRYQPIPRKTFTDILDYLLEKNKDVWTASFGEIGAYWKAQKVIEQAKTIKNGRAYSVKWKKPVPFPDGVTVLIKINGKDMSLSQAGKKISVVSQDVYRISFDAGEFLVKKDAKNNTAGKLIK
ncbi:MAG: polysaccharide deacetylase family protein [Spirochaetia bacterium]|nr:polysaccharide deacetylase family protein [Spirochaetia bacterium]